MGHPTLANSAEDNVKLISGLYMVLVMAVRVLIAAR